MYDETIIKEFMPKLKILASKYANDQYDEDELFSEGQLFLLEYLANKKNVNNKNKLSRGIYESVNGRLKTFASQKPSNITIALNDCTTLISPYPICKSDKLLNLLEDILTEREFIIVTGYYGILSNEKTGAEIAKELGITSSRISEIRRKAEKKIRRNFYLNNIDMDDLLF